MDLPLLARDGVYFVCRNHHKPVTETAIANCAKTNNLVVRLNDKFGEHYSFSVEYGRKYARIVQADPASSYAQRSVYCFVRIEDGAILKSASWKSPAKGVRAWLDQILASDLAGVDQYTGWLYRGR